MRLQLKGHAIFGDYLGFKDEGKEYILFMDEETGEIKTYHKSKLQYAYDK